MSQTCTITETKQLHLVNIITFAQDKLQTNFTRILARLNNHERLIQQNKILFTSLAERVNNITYDLQQKMNAQAQRNVELFSNSNQQIQKLSDALKKATQKISISQNSLNNLSKSHENMKIYLDSQSEARNLQYETTRQKIRNFEIQIAAINKNLDRKETLIQANKVRQTVNDLNFQFGKLTDEQKFVQFKLDKFQINNQKHEKNQMNKQIMMIKQLQNKIKSELKNSIQILHKSSNTSSMDNIQPIQNSSVHLLTNQKSIERPATVQNASQYQKENIFYQNSASTQINQKAINKINDNLNSFQRKFEIYDNELKQLTDIFETYVKQKKSNTTDFQEKINAIKPQFIKLWSKCDTIEDKNAFLQRRLQQKNKQITHILEILKQTQSSKFEQKLKMFQTEVFGKLQQQKLKIQGKVSNAQFQKFSKGVVDKIQILNDQVILKSDKLQVKKALLFLQSKIKQIILVISQEQQTEKDALLTKKQIKCISCDKDIDKFLGVASNLKGNWDIFPMKDHSPEVLGRFGMTSYGSLSRKLRRLDNKDIPVLSSQNRRGKQSLHSQIKS